MVQLISDKILYDLVERIYETACDPSLWPVFCDDLHKAIPDTVVSVHLTIDNTMLAQHCAVRGMEDNFMRSYLEHYQFINPYTDVFKTMKIGRVARASELVSGEWLQNKVFYQEWLRPQHDLTHAAGVTIASDDRRLMRVAMDIPSRRKHIEGPAALVLQRLGPHIARAFEVNDRLQAAAMSAGMLEGVVEHLDSAAVLLSEAGKVMSMNRAAERCVRYGKVWRVDRANRVVFQDPSDEQTFRNALRAIADPVSKPEATAFWVKDQERGMVIATVLPLTPARSIASAVGARRFGLLLFGTSSPSADTQKRLLRSLYGLTRAESDLAVLLAEGATVAEAAGTLGVTLATARNQLSAAMSKAGVRRQAELVTTVLNFTPKVRLD